MLRSQAPTCRLCPGDEEFDWDDDETPEPEGRSYSANYGETSLHRELDTEL